MKTLYTGVRLAEAARLILSHRLYVNGWCMRGDAQRIVKEVRELAENAPSIRNAAIALEFQDGVPVAACMQNMNHVQVFVRSKYRRKGIGSQLVSAVTAEGEKFGLYRYSPYGGEGVKGSWDFWRSVNLEYVG